MSIGGLCPVEMQRVPMGDVTRVDSFDEAKDVLEDKTKGSIVFRGQRDHRWSVTASFGRLKADEAARVKEAFGRFGGWARKSDALKGLSLDQIIGIAQHYGVPTSFIDWTRSAETALFFGCDGGQVGEKACIYYLDLDEWRRFWSILRLAQPDSDWAKMPTSMQILDIAVPDLWRLSRQKGLFIETPVTNFQLFYPLDGVVFPHSSDSIEWAHKQRQYYYPDQRSSLEERLYEFFMAEQIIANEATPEFNQLKGHMNIFHIAQQQTESIEHGSDPSTSSIDPAWVNLPDEPPDQTSATQAVPISPPVSIVDTFDRLTGFMSQVVDVLSRCQRSSPLNIVNDDHSAWGNKISGLLWKIESVWNAMRWLPYTDEEIMGVVVRLICRVCVPEDRLRLLESDRFQALESYAQQTDYELPQVANLIARRHDYLYPRHAAMTLEQRVMMGGGIVEIEFGSSGSGAYQRGWADHDSLILSMTPKAVSERTHWFGLLWERKWHPLDVFDFEGLRQEWVHSVIPSQVAYRGGNRSTANGPIGWGRVTSAGSGICPVFYSPAWIDRMGLP